MCNKQSRAHHARRASMGAMCATILVLWGTRALAHDIAAMPPAPDSLLVGDMLRIDADRAMAAELVKANTMSAALPQDMHTAPGLPPGSPSSTPAPAVLSAIYGVGTRLYADVLIQGQTVTYAAGRAQPIAASNRHTAYRLRAIRVPCVHLDARGAGGPSALALCLERQP